MHSHWSVCAVSGSSNASKLVGISLPEGCNASAVSIFFSVHFQCIIPVPVSASAGLGANVWAIVLITGQKTRLRNTSLELVKFWWRWTSLSPRATQTSTEAVTLIKSEFAIHLIN